MRSAVLFRTHRRDPDILAEFLRMRQSCEHTAIDPYLSYDRKVNDSCLPNEIVHLFTVDDLKRRFPVHFQDKPLWYNPEMCLIDFYEKHPQYDYYWLIEYDVRFAGDWKDFFDAFQNCDADLITSWLKTRYQLSDQLFVMPEWIYWKTMNFSIEPEIGSYFPVNRISKTGLQVLVECYKTGIHGFCEIIVPTLLFHAGLKLVDLKNFPSVFHPEYIRGAYVEGNLQNILYHSVRKAENELFTYGLPRTAEASS